MKNKIKAAIAGGTGYTGGELIRLLLNHPDVEIVSAISTSIAGTSIASVHTDLTGDTDMKFSNDLRGDEDVLFLCLGHGISRDFINSHRIPDNCKIIDLGNDFRTDNLFQGKDFTYGLVELNKEAIKKSNYIANPGCFATAIQLALLPLAEKKQISEEIHIHAITGSTGAGKKLAETSHFSYRNSNISVYKVFTHQHLDEIKKTLTSLQGGALPQINFIPMRGDFTRGIFASVYTAMDGDVNEIISEYRRFYQDSPFVHVSDAPLNMKDVVNTNKCLIHIEKHYQYIYITSIIDNLIKGASGQAVQNMNLMYSLNEDTGLKLKATAF